MKLVCVKQYRSVRCVRTFGVPDDFDPKNSEHAALLEQWQDGEDWDREDVSYVDTRVEAVNTADGSISPGTVLGWDDLREPGL